MNSAPPHPSSGDEREPPLTALLLGELSEADAAGLRQEIAANAELQKLHDELARTIGLVREAGVMLADDAGPAAEPLTLSAERREKLLATFKTVQLPVAPKKPRIAIPWRETGAVAAMLAMLAGVAVLLIRPSILPEDRLAESMDYLFAGLSKKKPGGVTALSMSTVSLEDRSDILVSAHGSPTSERPFSKGAAPSISPDDLAMGRSELNASPAPPVISELKFITLVTNAYIDGFTTTRVQPGANRFYYSANGAQRSVDQPAVAYKDKAEPEPASRPSIYLGAAADTSGNEDAAKAAANPAPESERYRRRYGAALADLASPANALKKEGDVLSRLGALTESRQQAVSALGGNLPDVGAQFFKSTAAQPSAGTPRPAAPEPLLLGTVVNGTASAPVGGAMPETSGSQQDSVGFALPAITAAGSISAGGGFGGSGRSLGLNRRLATGPAPAPGVPAAIALSPKPSAQAQPLGWFEGKPVDGDFVVATPFASADRKEPAASSEFRGIQGGPSTGWELSAGVRGFYDDAFSTAPASASVQANSSLVADLNGPVSDPQKGMKEEATLFQRAADLPAVGQKAQQPATGQERESLARQTGKEDYLEKGRGEALSDGSANGRGTVDAQRGAMRSKVLAQTKDESQVALNFGEATKELADKNNAAWEPALLAKLKASPAVSDPTLVGVLEKPVAGEKKPASGERLAEGLDRLEAVEAKDGRAGRLAAIVLPQQTDKELGAVVVAGKPTRAYASVADELKPAAKKPEDAKRQLDGPEVVAAKSFGRQDLKQSYKAALVEADAPALRKPAPNAAVPQPEVATVENAFSTFSLNVSDVTFKLAAASLEKGVMPDPSTVRTEEFINAFDYRDPEPPAGVPIAFATERARYPFAHDRDLVRFSVKTAAVGRQPGKPFNLVLAIDNSGSMERADRVRILRECIRTLGSQLLPEDRISVVSFARTARLWIDGVPVAEAGDLAERIGRLTPEGGTNLEEAMNVAYKTAMRHFVPGGVNRVVLITDGAANLGDVEPDSLKQKVETHRKQGIALDCFGIGWDGFNDDLLEVLSRNGDGRYGFINTPEAAATEFAGQLAGALKVAASDVKVQVEWNPRRVTAYRQIGYAKHQLKKEQFRDNTVDAAEIGAAEAGNALYAVQVNPAGEGPLGTVRVRFRVPNTSDYREHEWIVPYATPAPALDQASSTLRLAATASAFSEWLVASPFAAEVTPGKLLGHLRGIPEMHPADPRPKQLETMIRQAGTISGQ